MKTRPRARGFTLTELLVALAVIAVLAAVAVPAYESQIKKARRGDAITTLTTIQLAQEKWRANNVAYSTTASEVGYAGKGGNATLSLEGYYTVAFSAADANTFLVTATPVSGTPQADDDLCPVFAVTQDGKDTTGSYAPEHCWN